MQCYFSKSHQQLINSVVVFLLHIFSFFLITVVILVLETVRNTTIQIILLQIMVQYKWYMLLYIYWKNYDMKQSSQLETHDIIHIKHETLFWKREWYSWAPVLALSIPCAGGHPIADSTAQYSYILFPIISIACRLHQQVYMVNWI